MSVSSVIESVVEFIGHYGGEVDSVANALETVVKNIPIPKDAQATIVATVEKLRTASDNIQTALPGLVNAAPTPVTINESDIEKAVAAVLPDMVTRAVAEYMAVHNMPEETEQPS